MNKYITTICFIVLTLLMSSNRSLANEDILETTVNPFFAALKSGDIEALKSHVGGQLYQNINEASGQNEDYGAFLRSRYTNATFYPTVIRQDENNIIVSVNVDFASEGTSVFELLIEKDTAGSWRIVDQYSPVKTF